jgi:hypothetical protein
MHEINDSRAPALASVPGRLRGHHSPPYFLPGLVFAILIAVTGLARAQYTAIQYLSGTDRDDTVPWQFYVTGGGRSNNVATTIPVPSCWQTKGFGAYSYQNIPASTSVGQYSTVFSVPANWAGQRIYLVYEGVFTDTATVINGQTVAGSITNTSIISGTTNALPNDRALDDSAASSQGGAGGGALSPAGNVNLGTLSQFTLTAWIKPVADFSTMSGTEYPRLIMVGATPGYDTSTANGVALLGYNTTSVSAGLQLTINTGNIITPSGTLTGSSWVFVAVTYDSTLAKNNVNVYIGNPATTPALISTQTLAQGPVAFGTNAYAYLLNNSNLDRAFAGWGDDFRIYGSVLNQAALESVRDSALSNSAPASPTPLYQWNFNTATASSSVAPNVGTGGVLTLENAGGTAANLYSPIGLGVSGAASLPTTNVTITSTAHQGGFYEFSYDVTTNVVVGANTNVLNVTVSEWSANTSVNAAEREGDYWNFSGIFRPVYLAAMPPSNIQRLAVNAQASGLISVNAFLAGVTNPCLVVASVTDTNNVQLGSSFTSTVPAGATNVLLSATLPSPQLWSAEFPNLYTLTVQLLDANSNLIHTVTNLIGFRTIAFSNNVGYFVNGQKVLLRGITRHEAWPNAGRTTSQAESDLDIGLIKDMNFNAVRMSHYPPNKLFLQECDRLGLYVFDELAGWQHAYDSTIAPELVKEMVVRDVNHPCVIAWDNGNEGGWNTAVDGNFALWDPQNRHVNHPGAGTGKFNNVVDQHYPPYATFVGELGAGLPVCLPTEILHANYDGGGGACLPDFWDLMRTSPNGGGMFTWAFLDEGLVRDDKGGQVDVQDNKAPDGIVGPYRQPEASYYSYKSVYNPAQITGPDPTTFNGTLAVENRFSFTSLNQCTFNWQLGWYPDANDPAGTFNTCTNPLTGGFLVAVDGGNFAGPPVAPGAAGSLVLPGFPASGTNYDALRLIATDPLGNNLYTWTWPLHTPAQIHDRILGAVSLAAPAISAGASATEIIVTNGPRVFHFSNTSGFLDRLTVSNQPVSFTNGPVLVAGSWGGVTITNYSDGTNYIIMANDINSSPNAFQWRLRPDGWLTLTYLYTLTGSNNFMGITFNYPSNQVTGMSWLGQGPYRVYKNRTAGQEVFVHTKFYNYTWTGQGTLIAPGTTPWVYPEFEGYHGRLNWATLQTTEQPVTFATTSSNLFFCVLTPPVTDVANINPAYPPGNLSILDGIAPQGTKTQPPSSYAPSSALNSATGLYSNTVDFYFGPVPPSGADRDGDGLIDAWELQYFGKLGLNPDAHGANGVSLALDNAFDLSPTNADPNASRLPKAAPGTVTPIALAYRVPVSQLNDFNFVPQITDNLLSGWLSADLFPQYFLVSAVPANGSENAYSVQPNLVNWPGNTNHLFLRLRIDEK